MAFEECEAVVVVRRNPRRESIYLLINPSLSSQRTSSILVYFFVSLEWQSKQPWCGGARPSLTNYKVPHNVVYTGRGALSCGMESS